MDYGNLIGEAWRATWRHRGLWLLGLFAGQVGSRFSFNFPGGGPSGGTSSSGAGGGGGLPDPDELAQRVGEFLSQYGGLIVALFFVAAIVALVIWFLLLLLTSVAAGGMAWGTLEAANGLPATLRQSWGAGVRTLWRFFGLNVILSVFGVIAAVAALFSIGALVLGIFVGISGNAAKWAALLLPGGLLVGLLLLLLLVVSVLASIVVPFAQRSMVVQDCGPIQGLKAGWQLFRARLGTSIVLWLVSIAMGIALGFCVLFALFLLGVPLVLIGIVIGAAAGQGFLLYAYIAVAALTVFCLLLLAGAIVNSFQWHFWTRGYLRLT